MVSPRCSARPPGPMCCPDGSAFLGAKQRDESPRRAPISRMSTSSETVMAVYAEWEAANAKVARLSLDALTHTELLALQHRREVVARSMPAVDHQIVNRPAVEADPKALGGTSLADVMATRLGISKQEANRRIKLAGLLGPRQALTGETLPPALPNVAAVQARGEIGAEHVRIIEKFFDELPNRIDAPTREQAEADLARTATGLGPTQFRAAADRLALLLNQDGELPDEADRARRRYLTIDKQDVDGMSRMHGLLDPEARATLDAVFAKLAAPGMCNSEDENPCIDGEPDADAVQRDARSPGQRNHDALTAMGRSVLASGELGRHNGLPATIIIVRLIHCKIVAWTTPASTPASATTRKRPTTATSLVETAKAWV